MKPEFPDTFGAVTGASYYPLAESRSARTILHDPLLIPGYENIMGTLERYMEPTKNPHWDMFPDILRNLLKDVNNRLGVVMHYDDLTADFSLIPVGEEHYLLVPILSRQETPDHFWLLGSSPAELYINTVGELSIKQTRANADSGQRTSSKITLLAPKDMILATEIKTPDEEVTRTTCLGYSHGGQKTTLELNMAYSHPSGIVGRISRIRFRGDTGEEESQIQMGLGGLESNASISIPGDPSNTQIQIAVNGVTGICVGIEDGFLPLSVPARDFIADLRTNPAEGLPSLSQMLHTAVETAKLT
ncbi:MAG: hypothetical protein WC489_03475 [Patescibacteria group bacterium]